MVYFAFLIPPFSTFVLLFQVELDFLAEFLFTIGPLYKAKPLVVGTTLTTESSQGPLRRFVFSTLRGGPQFCLQRLRAAALLLGCASSAERVVSFCR